MTVDAEFHLAAPDESHEKAYMEMMAEWQAFGGRTNPNALLNWGAPYKAWLANVRHNADHARTASGGIPHILYFLLRQGDDRIYGAAIIRYSLSDSVWKIGGHIGYGIRPSERKKGYATRLLALALGKCRGLGIEKAVIVCGKDNEGSCQVAINNGGVPDPETLNNPGIGLIRYWIDLTIDFPKAILFDLDDTIISYEGPADETWRDCAAGFIAKHNPGFDVETLMRHIDATRVWFWGDPVRHAAARQDMIGSRREVVRLALRELGETDEAKIVDLADCFSRLRDERLRLFPDAIGALTALKNRGVRMALITNGASETQRAKIERFGLSNFFETILIEGEVGYGKPDARIFQLALETLGLQPGDVWMVGDNLEWEIRVPQQMGIFAVWNDYRRAGLPEGADIKPDRIINGISELLLK